MNLLIRQSIFHLCIIPDQEHRLDRHDLVEFFLGDGYIRVDLFQIIFYNSNAFLHRLGAPLTDSTLHPLYSHRMKITGREPEVRDGGCPHNP